MYLSKHIFRYHKKERKKNYKIWFLLLSYYLWNQTEKRIEDLRLTSWEEILSQVGGVLL